jgi:hypothetical protein
MEPKKLKVEVVNFTFYFFLHIVMKVALFHTKNRSESSTFLHETS